MTSYVYILVSHENNNYVAMCLISALSVRGVDADAKITVLSDGRTLAMLKHCNHQLLDVADEVLDCSMNESPKIASRILKTTMLRRLQTDFIFLDVDTIVARPIAHRLRQPCCLQMALDRSPYHPIPGFPEYAIPYYQEFKWKWPTHRYFNSGVMFVHADEETKKLFEEWYRRWQIWIATGRHHDQPALNSAIEELGLTVGVLPTPYNAMVRVNEAFRWRARVIHFFAEGEYLDEGTEYAKLAASVASGSVLTSKEIRKAVSRRWPLVEPWKLRRHVKAGSLRGAWQHYKNRLGIKPSQGQPENK